MMSKPKNQKAPVEASFEEMFKNRLDKIEADAKAIGSNMTVICKEAGVGRAGPVRWRHAVPYSIKLVDRMSAVVKKLTKKHASKG